jgi:hypothetical protein
MEYGKCPGCGHEIYDRVQGKCPFCGHKLPSGRATGSSGYGGQQARKAKVIILAALIALALAGGIVAALISAQVEEKKDGGINSLMTPGVTAAAASIQV